MTCTGCRALAYYAAFPYRVTADSPIYAPDNSLLYQKGDIVADNLTTNENGEVSLNNVPLGTYVIEEIAAPAGYVLATEKQRLTLSYAGQEAEIAFDETTFTNERQKVSVHVIKQDSETKKTLKGAEFAIYAGSEIVSYKGDHLVSAGSMIETAKTDADGSITFKADLPLGFKYVVREVGAPVGYIATKEEYSFAASAAEPTKKTIAYEHTFTNDHIAPYGYLIATTVKFTVGDTDEIQKVVMKDEVPKGTIIINKKGEFLSSVSTLDNVGGWIENTFSYITGSLSDVTFAVYAAEDIKHADGATRDYYKAGDLVANITTDNTGIAKLEGLPLGKYVVQEVETAAGYVLDDEERFIDLSYRDSKTAVVTYSEEWQNDRMKVRVKVTKTSEGESTLLEGATFGLFNEDDITSDNGKVLLKAGSLIQQRATDSTGSLIFDADLPTDFSYYIQEIVPPAGYASDPEVQRFFFERMSYIDEVTIFREFTFIDKPTEVEITKSILTMGEELEGAKLQVTDSEGNVVDSWTSEKEPHKITGLVVGKTYQLVETLPADGYVTAETIEFTIADTSEVQPIEMKDDITKLKISKQDIAGNELEGAKLTLSKENGEVIETWTSGKEPHYIEMLPIGKYKLHEETAPDGYLVAEDITFEVKDTGEIQSCVMKDENSPDNPGTPKTGDPLDPKTWGIVGIVAVLGVLTSILIIRKNRRKF